MATPQSTNSPRSVEDLINRISPFDPIQEIEDLTNAGLIDRVMYADPLREAGMYDSTYTAPQGPRNTPPPSVDIPPNPKPRPSNLQARRNPPQASLIPNVDTTNIRRTAENVRGVVNDVGTAVVTAFSNPSRWIPRGSRGISTTKPEHNLTRLFPNVHPERQALYNSMFMVESIGNHRARNTGSGATGLGQLKPSTAAEQAKLMGLRLRPGDLWNPEINAKISIGYLERMRKMFGNDILALAAYNGGPRTVQNAIRRAGTTSWNVLHKFLPTETQLYVPLVYREMDAFKNLFMRGKDE